MQLLSRGELDHCARWSCATALQRQTAVLAHTGRASQA